MTTLIVLAVVAVIIYGIWKISKNKKQSDKSGVESIIGTVMEKVSQAGMETAKSMRDAKTVAKELLAKIDKNLANSKQNLDDWLTQLHTSSSRNDADEAEYKKQIGILKHQAKEAKDGFVKHGEEEYKVEAYDCLKAIKEYETMLVEIDADRKVIDKQHRSAGREYNSYVRKLQSKRARIARESNPIHLMATVGFSTADLEEEFNMKLREQKITIAVKKDMDKILGSEEVIAVTVTDSELNDAFDKL